MGNSSVTLGHKPSGGGGAAADDETARDLVRLLECPVCLEPMRAPIEQCDNGHNLCAVCRRRVARCPACRGDFRGTRNRLAEDVAARLLRRGCPYRPGGCLESLFPADLEAHRLACRFRPYRCHVCCAFVALAHLRAHCQKEHPKHLVSAPLCLELSLDPRAPGEQYGCHLLAACGKLFWFWRRITASAVFMGVQSCAPERDEPPFFYRIELSDAPRRRELSFAGPVHDAEQSQRALEEAAKCFSVSRRFAANILDAGAARLKLTVF